MTSSSPLWTTEAAGDAAGAPLVVVVHGSMDRSASFAKVQRRLAGFRVVRYDRRGYDHSVDAWVADGVDGHVDDLLAVLDGRRATVVGHSFGGVVALAAAQRAPEVVRSVLAFEAPMPWAPWWPARSAGSAALAGGTATPAEAAERFVRTLAGDRFWERLPARVRALRQAEGAALVAEMRALRTGTAPFDSTTITVPVVAGRGTESVERHRRATAELAATAPRGELMTIEGAAHGAHLSHPDAFADLVRLAVRRVGVAERTP
ncbi:alpha/beta hydrolase [soil metagenome]